MKVKSVEGVPLVGLTVPLQMFQDDGGAGGQGAAATGWTFQPANHAAASTTARAALEILRFTLPLIRVRQMRTERAPPDPSVSVGHPSGSA